MRAFKALRRLCSSRGSDVSRVIPLSSVDIVSEHWEPLVPKHSNAEAIHLEQFDDHNSPVPSVPTHSRSEEGDPTSMICPQQYPNTLDGIWVLKDSQQIDSPISDEVRFMVIQGENLTNAHMQTYAVERADTPNTILFGDAVGQVSTDATLKLMLANGRHALYGRLDPPPESMMRALQGTWILRSKGEDDGGVILNIEGVIVEFFDKDKRSHHFLHVRKGDGSLRLLGLMVDIASHGSLFLHTKSGKLLKFVHASVYPNLVAIQEELP